MIWALPSVLVWFKPLSLPHVIVIFFIKVFFLAQRSALTVLNCRIKARSHHTLTIGAARRELTVTPWSIGALGFNFFLKWPTSHQWPVVPKAIYVQVLSVFICLTLLFTESLLKLLLKYIKALFCCALKQILSTLLALLCTDVRSYVTFPGNQYFVCVWHLQAVYNLMWLHI